MCLETKPLWVSSPRWEFYFPGGTMLGILLGAGLALLVELLNDLQAGIFSELISGNPGMDIYRRNLQRAYVEQLITFITPGTAAKNDLQAVSRGKLIELEKSLGKQIRKKTYTVEHYHFVDLKETIGLALKGK